MKRHWLYIKHDVFIWEDGENALIYNSENGEYVIIELDESIKNIILSLLNIENLNCITVEEFDINESVNRLVFNLRSISAGDIIECSNDIFQKPISYPAVLNLQNVSANQILGGETNLKKEDVIKYLHHLTINLGNRWGTHKKFHSQIDFPVPITTSFSQIKEIFNKVFPYKIPQVTLLGLDNYDSKSFIKIVERAFEIAQRINIRLTTYQFKLIQCNLKAVKYRFEVEILFDTKEDDTSIFDNLFVTNRCSIIFIVRDNCDCETVDNIVTLKHVADYTTIPFYDGDNFQFIIENVFPTKKEMLEMSLTKREIFCNQVLNPSKFGHLTIIGNKVYSDISNEPIGNIDEPFRDLVLRAIEPTSPWMSVRSKNGCSKCLLRYICPPINNLERELNTELNIRCFFK